MSDLEDALHATLRGVVHHPAALGLADDAAILDWPLGQQLVATHDMLAEGVHFTPDCPPVDIGWKLVAVNLSDLAAMGARPVAVLMGAGIAVRRDAAWARELVRGMAQALDRFAVPLIGGDTIRTADTSVLALTALGQLPAGTALARSGARGGDDLWVSGSIGDAGLGLSVALGRRLHDAVALKRYRRPMPRLELGAALRGLATAAIDVSDGLALDASRMARASGVSARIDTAAIPCREHPVAAATSGDDYELLFSAPPARAAAVLAAASHSRTPVTRIGHMAEDGPPVVLTGEDGADVTPDNLGWRHF